MTVLKSLNNSYKFAAGIVVLIGLLLLLSPLADPNPDGLESAAGQYDAPEGEALDLGFFTDYGGEGSLLYQLVGNEAVATILAGTIGAIIVFGVLFAPILIIKKKKNNNREIEK